MKPVFMRREPTTDSNAPGKRDVVAYADEHMTQPVARFAWHNTYPRRTQKQIRIAGESYEPVWREASQ